MLLNNIILVPRNIAIAFMKAYRRGISPLYGNVCRFYPSCSRYALSAYQTRSFFIATALTLFRLVRCNPWNHGGVDDVKPPKHQTTEITARGFVRAAKRKA
ncbi:MAG: membrane protein insertion efficiency factor YidD [Microbacteriaceae bacterium]|nr:membrane protein insertion efficiency factor YidD [Microbacteriaceae bacterium]